MKTHHQGLQWARRLYIAAVMGIMVLTASVFVVQVTGCKNTGLVLSGSEGAYAGDLVLANYDATAKTAKESIGRFLKWEETNRAWLDAKAPQVAHFAQKLRLEAPPAFAKGLEARQLYIAARGDATAKPLNNALDVINLLVDAATLYYAQHEPSIP